MGSSSSNEAQREAERAERARQAAITASVGKIDNVFSDPRRQAQYDDFFSASRGVYNDELGRRQQENARQLKFAMARSGNAGGSLAIDQGRDLGEAYNKGLIEAERMAQSDLAGLKQNDQESRLRLIQMAQGGLDATTGVRNASEAMRSNLLAGKATRNVQSLGDVFGGFADIFKRSREEKSRREGEKYAYNTLYQPGFFTGQGQGK